MKVEVDVLDVPSGPYGLCGRRATLNLKQKPTAFVLRLGVSRNLWRRRPGRDQYIQNTVQSGTIEPSPRSRELDKERK